jgi:hypothetical protein
MPEHRIMRPSGVYSHGLGVVGATMIIVGVAMYSSRKRMKSLRDVGKLSVWLEIHIVLCLLGPILVIYHTTFKAGGIAAISLWTMLSVASSGIIGRFLYVLIPRNTVGGELSRGQINEEFDRISKVLLRTEEGKQVLNGLDERFSAIERPRSIMGTIRCFLKLQTIKRETERRTVQLLRSRTLSRELSRDLRNAAHARVRLLQKSILLIQVERLFFLWHAIHLPFSIIMLITLVVHVGVALWLGYTWIL